MSKEEPFGPKGWVKEVVAAKHLTTEQIDKLPKERKNALLSALVNITAYSTQSTPAQIARDIVSRLPSDMKKEYEKIYAPFKDFLKKSGK